MRSPNGHQPVNAENLWARALVGYSADGGRYPPVTLICRDTAGR
jgi:hypothetical protein